MEWNNLENFHAIYENVSKILKSMNLHIPKKKEPIDREDHALIMKTFEFENVTKDPLLLVKKVEWDVRFYAGHVKKCYIKSRNENDKKYSEKMFANNFKR